MAPTSEALAKHYKVARVKVDNNKELAGHYNVSSIPALMIFKNGKIVTQHVGVMPEATLRAELQRMSEKA